MSFLWKLSLDQLEELYEKAEEMGIFGGEEMEKVVTLYAQENNIKPIGRTDKDIDQICGEIRESDPKFKVLNFNEIERRRNK